MLPELALKSVTRKCWLVPVCCGKCCLFLRFCNRVQYLETFQKLGQVGKVQEPALLGFPGTLGQPEVPHGEFASGHSGLGECLCA